MQVGAFSKTKEDSQVISLNKLFRIYVELIFPDAIYVDKLSQP